MNKRGTFATEETLMTLIKLVLVVFVLLTFFGFAGTISERSDFKTRYIAKDMALLIDAMLGQSGDSWVKYPLKEKVFVQLGDELSVARNDKKTDMQRFKVHYSGNDKGNWYDSIYFSKQGEKFSISSTKEKYGLRECESFKVKSWSIVSKNKDTLASDLARHTEADIVEAPSPKYDGLLILKYRPGPAAAVYVNENSYPFGCRLANELIKSGIKGVGIIKVEEKFSDLPIFGNSMAAVLEIGNEKAEVAIAEAMK